MAMSNTLSETRLAIDGGPPVRREPLPLEFPGVHFMGEEEVEAATRVLRSRSPFRFYGVDLQGEVSSFEKEFADFIGIQHAVAVSCGTGALLTALGALGVGPGREVIVPAYLWVSVAAAVVNRGAIPVVADIDDTFCLDPEAVERAITPRTAGIILVHMSGAPGNAPAIAEVARRHSVFLLEDCAQCAGGAINGRKVGTFGDIAIYSFQMNKNMTAGEGGCVVTNDERLYRRAYACHDLGYARDPEGRLAFQDAECCLWGMGYRMDEIRGAILRVQLRKLPAITASMRRSKYRIRHAIQRCEGLALRRTQDEEGDTGCFLITTYRDAETAKWVCQALKAEGIGTSPQGISNVVMTDWGLHIYSNIPSLVQRTSVDSQGFPWSHPANAGLGRGCAHGACPKADDLFSRSIIVPIPSCLSTQDEDDIIAAFEKVMAAQEARRSSARIS